MTIPAVLTGVLLDALVAAVRRILDELVKEPAALPLVPETDRPFVEAMCGEFGAKVRTKSALPMRLVAAAFDVADLFVDGLPNGSEFMERFSTTIGAEVFIPEAILRAGGQVLREIVTHECEHVAQFRAEGIAFVWLYASEPEARARYEANAYAAGGAVAVAFGRQVPSVDALLPDLVASYHVRAQDQALARDMMESLAQSLSAGVVNTVAGAYAVAWLRAHP